MSKYPIVNYFNLEKEIKAPLGFIELGEELERKLIEKCKEHIKNNASFNVEMIPTFTRKENGEIKLNDFSFYIRDV